MGKWTRRGFIGAGLVAGGALVVGVAIRPGDRTGKLAKHVTEGNENLLTAWVKIAPDNTVTAIIPHGEMGQGIHTALSAMLAEEMDADWEKMAVMEAPAEKDYANFPLVREFLLGGKQPPGMVYDTVNGAFLAISKSMDMQITGGSTSVRFTGTGAMQTAGAAARELLLKAASKAWDVSAKDLRVEKSYIYHDASNRSAPFADFAAAASEMKPNIRPSLKARKDYTLMGKALPRIDIPPKVDGTAMFGIDAKVPGMKYAAVMASPVVGETVTAMNVKAAMSMSGVHGVYDMGTYVAVVADGYWQAKQALENVEVEFTASASNAVNEASIFAQYAAALDTGKKKKLHKVGDAESVINEAASVFKAEYKVPHLAHACMEPMNATAWVRDGKCDLWAGTQNPLGTRNATAKHLDMDIENVTLHTFFMGGGFGRRSDVDFTNKAVDVAKIAGVPVKLIWSREETTQQDRYRPSVLGRFQASLDDNGKPSAWNSQFVHKLDPPEASDVFYDIPNQSIQFAESPTHIPFGPWRSVDHTQHGFFTESFIDELAHEAGVDGYTYRRNLLQNKPRHLAVLDAAAKKAGWGNPLPDGQAQGIAITESFMTIVAEVVTVDMNSGEPKVTKVVCAADAGMAVNPDGFAAQMESGIIYGLTAALYGEITIEDGAVEQSNFHDYQMVRMDDAPDIDVVILTSDAPLGGAGEPGTPPIAPAVTNAIFAATGKRIRTLPVMNTNFGEAT
ncbi:MAG: molybdopterin cofactor-binding domain-containing protein [Alphaproteobacteria bacterium]